MVRLFKGGASSHTEAHLQALSGVVTTILVMNVHLGKFPAWLLTPHTAQGHRIPAAPVERRQRDRTRRLGEPRRKHPQGRARAAQDARTPPRRNIRKVDSKSRRRGHPRTSPRETTPCKRGHAGRKAARRRRRLSWEAPQPPCRCPILQTNTTTQTRRTTTRTRTSRTSSS